MALNISSTGSFILHIKHVSEIQMAPMAW